MSSVYFLWLEFSVVLLSCVIGQHSPSDFSCFSHKAAANADVLQSIPSVEISGQILSCCKLP